MVKAVKWRRGTTSEHLIFTGVEGEITVDTTKKTAIVHDNAQAGGFPLAREDLSNVSDALLSSRGLALGDMSNVATDDIANRGIAKNDLSNLTGADATESQKGVIQLATITEAQTGTNTTKAITPAGLTATLNSAGGLPTGYISGLTLAIGTDAEHEIIVAEGACKTFDGTADVNLLSSLTKEIDATWVVGNAGGMPAPLTAQASTTYHVFAITNPSTGAVDAGFDTDISATNLLNVASGFTKFRRIGSIKTDTNSNLVNFKSKGNGDRIEIFYTTPSVDLNTNANGSSWANLSLNLPSGLELQPYLQLISDGDEVGYKTNAYFRSVGRLDDGLVLHTQDSQSEYCCISDHSMTTNSAGQIQYKVVPQNASYKPIIKVVTIGYSDFR
ncbi:MAG: hypothetical protein ACTSUM_01215 [Alphaproteobacteria bacterium]